MEEGREEEKMEEKRKGFSLFWEKYPRKVGKEDTFRAFLDCDVELDTLLQAVSRHCESEEWQRQSGRFIPNPANYLRARRFEDELTAARGGDHKAGGGIGGGKAANHGAGGAASGTWAAQSAQGGCDEAMRRYLAALHERRVP